MFIFVLYAGIVHVQSYRGWYVETGYVNTIFGKFHKLKCAILTRHNTYLGHTGFARSFQRMESLLVEIGQTAHKLETNARTKFSHATELGISMYGEWGEKHAHTDIFLAHCGFQAQY